MAKPDEHVTSQCCPKCTMDVTPETKAWHATTCDGLGAQASEPDTPSEALHALAVMTRRALAAERQVADLEKLVYVPGVTKCAKCACVLVSNTLDASSGRIAANRSPQDCPNGCGPMWRVTQRDVGNDLVDRLEAKTVDHSLTQILLADSDAVIAAMFESNGYVRVGHVNMIPGDGAARLAAVNRAIERHQKREASA